MSQERIEKELASLVPPQLDRSPFRCGGCFFLDKETVKTQRSNDPHEIPVTTDVYFCHRFPPRIPDMSTSIPHPVVNPLKDWCGEFSDWRRYAQTEGEENGEETSKEGHQEEVEVGREVQAQEA